MGGAAKARGGFEPGRSRGSQRRRGLGVAAPRGAKSNGDPRRTGPVRWREVAPAVSGYPRRAHTPL